MEHVYQSCGHHYEAKDGRVNNYDLEDRPMRIPQARQQHKTAHTYDAETDDGLHGSLLGDEFSGRYRWS